MNQNFEIKISNSLELLLGVKYESKRLTKFYDVPGYTATSYSSATIPSGYRGNVSSTEPFYLRPPPPADKMPENNLISTTDYGGFAQGKLSISKFIFSPGIRYDENSIYGHSMNHLSTSCTVGSPGDKQILALSRKRLGLQNLYS